MIKVALSAALGALRAFEHIGAAPMPPKAAYRVARLIAKLRAEDRAFGEVQGKILKENGGTSTGTGVSIRAPERKKDESDAAFAERRASHEAAMIKITEQLIDLGKQQIEIEYDPIPLSLFELNEQDPADPKAKVIKPNLTPNDVAAALPFFSD